VGTRRTLADTTEVLSLNTKQADDIALPPRGSASKVTTSRPSYSFGRSDSSRKSEACRKTTAVTQSRSSSPTKKMTMLPTKTASQELASRSHQKAHVNAINNTSSVQKLPSPRVASTFLTTHPIPLSTPSISLRCRRSCKPPLLHLTSTRWGNSNPKQPHPPLPITRSRR